MKWPFVSRRKAEASAHWDRLASQSNAFYYLREASRDGRAHERDRIRQRVEMLPYVYTLGDPPAVRLSDVLSIIDGETRDD